MCRACIDRDVDQQVSPRFGAGFAGELARLTLNLPLRLS